MKIIIASQENSINYAIQEIRENFSVNKIERFKDGVFLCDLEQEFSTVSETIRNKKLIFIRHIFPVLFEKKLTSTEEDFNILPSIFSNFKINGNDKIAIHLNFLDDDITYRKVDFLNPLMTLLGEKNITLDSKNPNKVISILGYNKTAYVGISTPEENITTWPLGQYRFRKGENQISRAEFKLLEAIDYFKIDLAKYKTAIDLGASPGGWTKILLDNGLRVIAVDPAELDSSIRSNKNLVYYGGLSQQYFKENRGNKYDIIVNDMKMKTKKSIAIMKHAMEHLSKDGIGIMTLKLNPNRELEEAREAIKLLEKDHKVVGIRQLFHNRSEVTVLFKNRVRLFV